MLDLRKAPPSTDIVIAPVISAQTISALKHMFPRARVVLTEVEDADLGVSSPVRFGGPSTPVPMATSWPAI